MKNHKHCIERIYLNNFNAVVSEHVHRYIFASNFVKEKITLDIACGSGYGTSYLAKHAKYVYGIDIDSETINENKKIYKEKNIQFIHADAHNIPLDNESIDVVVSFETIEHLYNANLFLKEIKRVLKKEGMLLISTPNKKNSEENNIKNDYHIREYYEHEFRNLISFYFKNLIFFFQTTKYVNIIYPNENDNLKLNYANINSSEMLLKKQIELNSVNSMSKEYFITIASDSNIKLDYNFYLLDFTEYINFMINDLYNSKTYKIGHYLTLPIKYFLHITNIKKYNQFER
ncbi:MAG: class I SAM-dependent methyltransferase [Bacteroidales bacterium]|nr:class I SAM-dependent methyltransferase [Bacteroidales bacterium]